MGLDRPWGAQISSPLHPASPAAKAGLRQGDVVVRFNGADVTDLNHLINMVSMAPIGQPAEVVIWRDNKELVRSVTVADREVTLALSQNQPAERRRDTPNALLRRPARPDAPEPMGLELVVLDASTAKKFGIPETLRGVAVAKIDPNSPWAPYLQPSDVIEAIGGRTVRSVDEVLHALGQGSGSTPLDLVLQRRVNGTMQGRAIRIP
jgi:serine protease Do